MEKGAGNEVFRQAVINGEANAQTLNKELIHFIYRLLFLFIIEDRNLVYNIGAPDTDNDYDQKVRCRDIYKKYYAVSRLRRLSELPYLRNERYCDLWEGLMDSFRLLRMKHLELHSLSSLLEAYYLLLRHCIIYINARLPMNSFSGCFLLSK